MHSFGCPTCRKINYPFYGPVAWSLFWLCGRFALAQSSPELGQGWMAEYNLAARQLVMLAEAIPEEKFKWRSEPGVRSTSEVLMHIAYGNYWLLHQAGGKIPDDTPDISAGFGKEGDGKGRGNPLAQQFTQSR